MYNDFKGSKYNAELKTKDIARLVKKEAMQKYPGLKIKAQSEAYTSVRILVYLDKEEYRAKCFKDIPSGWIYSRIEAKIGKNGRVSDDDLKKYLENNIIKSKKAIEIEKDIMSMLNSYNYDRSDIMTDYFDKNFCGFVDIELI